MHYYYWLLFLVTEQELLVLRKELRNSKRAAFAKGTHRNLQVQWESYLLFCNYFMFTPFPATEEVVTLYAQFLSRSFKSADSIQNYIAGVKTLHNILDITFPEEHFHLKLSLKGIRKSLAHCPRQMEPMTPEILYRIHAVLDFSSTVHTCIWCLFLFAFFLFARKSNLVPDNNTDFSKCLLRKHVSPYKENLLVSFHWTKTIQNSERVLRLPLLRTDSILCPVVAYENMVSIIQVPDDAPLFSLSSSSVITYSKFMKNLRFLLQMIGTDPKRFGTHSFRRGGATLAFRAGVPADLIKTQGDWKSDAYQRYIEVSVDDKLNVAKLMNQEMSKHE